MIQMLICLLLWLIRCQLQHHCLVCMMHCVTKTTPIKFIDGNKLKSCRTGLTNHTRPISHHITPLVINALRSDTHTQTHRHILMCQQKWFQETRHVWPSAVWTWFKYPLKNTFTVAFLLTSSLQYYHINCAIANQKLVTDIKPVILIIYLAK